jgi:hypothetical protein
VFRIPPVVLHIAIAINLINFGFGFIIASEGLMLLALLSGLLCYVGLATNGDDDE